jgi:hypothetical protein
LLDRRRPLSGHTAQPHTQTTPLAPRPTDPAQESNIASVDARSQPLREVSTTSHLTADGMPRAPTCKTINDPAARLRSLIEKHLIQIQVLGERTHSRSESERRIFRLLVEGAAGMEGLSLGLVHGRPLPAGCVRRIALTCGFTSPVRSRTLFRTATDQKVRGSSPFGRAWSEGCEPSAGLFGSQWVSILPGLPPTVAS